MPTTDNKNELKPTPDSPAAAMSELATEGLPPWATKSLEFAKKYQNVFYAIATVTLLTWAVLKFQARRKEEKINDGWDDLAKAQSVDALRGLLEKCQGLPIEPYIRLRIANKLTDDGKLDEAIKEFGELKTKFNETLPGKLAGQQEKTVQENKAWSGKDGLLEKELDKLRMANKDEVKLTPAVGVKIEDKELPRGRAGSIDRKSCHRAGRRQGAECDGDVHPASGAELVRHDECLQGRTHGSLHGRPDAGRQFGSGVHDPV